MASTSKRRRISPVACASKKLRTVSQILGSKTNDCADRFSELPDEVLVHILSFLPTVDAVRTILLRSFGNLWTLLPSLSFDDDLFVEKFCCTNKNVRVKEDFTCFVHHVLKLHKRTNIDRFHLRLHQLHLLEREDVTALDATEVNKWISFAMDCEVKDLDLQFDHGVHSSIFPCVFTNQFLVTLKLSNCVIEHLSQVHMGCLRELSLIAVDVGNKTFKDLLSGCPSLQKLLVDTPSRCGLGLKEVFITTPGIEMLDASLGLHVLDCPYVKILNLVCTSPPKIVDASAVRKATVRFCFHCSRVGSLLEKLCNVEDLTFSTLDYKSFKRENLELDFVQTRWKRLCFQAYLHFHNLFCICKLLRSSPHLEELIIYDVNWKTPASMVISCSCEETEFFPHGMISSPCVLPQLKSVTLVGYAASGCLHLLELAKFLLKSAVKLEKLVLILRECDGGVDRARSFKKNVPRLPRASSNARIVWKKLNIYWREWLERHCQTKFFDDRRANVKSLKRICCT